MNTKSGKKSQSAMEYLMTYGWAVLIIGVVLAALVSLGTFNSALWGPRASAGSCKAFRSTAITTLEGVCNNVIPQSVAQFNGQSSYISTGTTGLPTGSSARSVFGWIYTPASPSWNGIFGYGTAAGGQLSALWLGNSGHTNNCLYFAGYADDAQATSPLCPSPNTWYFIGYTYTSGSTSVTLYVDGQSQTHSLAGASAGPLSTVLGSSYIGKDPENVDLFQGFISNVQVYNTALDANQVQALYMEGIGGVPVNLQYIVGWWPLNGDFNDYSGNGNAGTPTSVSFTSSWTSGYTTP